MEEKLHRRWVKIGGKKGSIFNGKLHKLQGFNVGRLLRCAASLTHMACHSLRSHLHHMVLSSYYFNLMVKYAQKQARVVRMVAEMERSAAKR